MSRTILALALGTTVASALPALAGPSGSVVPSYFPLRQELSVPHEEQPHGLLGDADRRYDTRAGRDDVRATQPALGWQRRPSEAK